MTLLWSMQEAFWQALESNSSEPPALAADLRRDGKLPGPKGLQIYRDMYLGRVTENLRWNFPLVAKLLGTEVFSALCRDYVRQHPSTSSSSLQIGRHFAAFATPQRTGRADVTDLAALEWARALIVREARVPSVTPQELTSLGDRVGAARLHFATTLTTLRLNHDVIGLWHALQTNRAISAQPLAAATHIAVWRRRDEARHCRLSAEAAEALSRAQSGAKLDHACEAFAHLPNSADAASTELGAWLVDGWVTAVEV